MNKLYPPGPQGGAKSRVKNHCRKFWWCDCIVFIVVVLVIILPIIFVAIPKKAQHEINASTLEVTSQEVSEPTANQVHLKLKSVIRSDSSYHPTVDPFVAGLSLEGQDPFMHIRIPEIKSEAETQVYVDQYVDFASHEAFSNYTKAVMEAETLNVHLDGKTQVHLKGLPGMDVNYNKVISMKGLNKFKGLNITSVQFLSSASQLLSSASQLLSGVSQLFSDGSNMIGTVYIPNPSVMTLDLGNVTMNLAIDGTPIGHALLPSLILKPGNNTVNVEAQIQPLIVFGLVIKKYNNAIVPLEITGNSSVRNGETLTYFQEAIQGTVFKLDLDVGPALATGGFKFNGTSG